MSQKRYFYRTTAITKVVIAHSASVLLWEIFTDIQYVCGLYPGAGHATTLPAATM